MLVHRRGPPPDPDQRMVGRCATCGTAAEVEHWQATKLPTGFHADPLADLYFVECQSPTCKTAKHPGARVYLMPKRKEP